MEKFSATEKHELLSFVATCMNLEDIMLGKLSQTQKTNTIRSHSFIASKTVHLKEVGNGTVVTRGWGGQKRGKNKDESTGNKIKVRSSSGVLLHHNVSM